MAISNLPDKEFKGMVIKMLTKLRTEMEEHMRTSAKRESIKKNQSLLENMITKVKNILEGTNSR